MTNRETLTLALIGFGIWLSGAVTFRFGGALMFESGLPILLAVGVGVGLSVCMLLRSIMGWRKIDGSHALTAAVVMTLPGLLGDVAYILNFSALTGLKPETAGPFAAVLIFGTAMLLGYGLIVARRVSPSVG